MKRFLHPQWLVALGLPVAVGLALLLGLGFSLPVALPAQAMPPAPPLDGVTAVYTGTQTFATTYPHRALGTPEHAAAQAWLKTQLTALGYTVQSSAFTVRVASQAVPGENLWVVRPGSKPQVFLLTTAFDTLPATNPEFSNDTSGMVTLLALAQAWADQTPTHTLVFLFADSSVYGPAWGAQQFLATAGLTPTLALELAPAGQPPAYAGFQQGYTPPWLQQITTPAPDALTTFGQHISPLALTNAGVYLRAGIPAVRWPVPAVNQAADFPAQLESLANLVVGIDALPIETPNQSGVAQGWRYAPDRYIPDGMLLVLAAVLFLPLWAATLWEWQRNLVGLPPAPRWRLRWLRLLFPELGVVMGLLVTLLDGYAFAYILINQGLLPRYEQFPATPSDPFLLEPTVWAALLIYGFMALFGWFIFRRFYGAARRSVLTPTPHRRLTLLVLMALLTLGSVLLNPYAAISLWFLPAYLWWWIAPRPGRWGLVLNLYLTLLGVLPLILWVAQWDELRFGVWWWFLPLAFAYGTFSPFALFGGALTLALGLRFFLVNRHRPAPKPAPIVIPTLYKN